MSNLKISLMLTALTGMALHVSFQRKGICMLAIIFATAISGIVLYIYIYHLQNKELIRLAYIDSLTGGDNY